MMKSASVRSSFKPLPPAARSPRHQGLPCCGLKRTRCRSVPGVGNMAGIWNGENGGGSTQGGEGRVRERRALPGSRPHPFRRHLLTPDAKATGRPRRHGTATERRPECALRAPEVLQAVSLPPVGRDTASPFSPFPAPLRAFVRRLHCVASTRGPLRASPPQQGTPNRRSGGEAVVSQLQPSYLLLPVVPTRVV